MPQPSEYPDWATNPADPASAIVAPPASRVESGWSPAEAPPAQNFNWWKNLVGRWIRWIDERRTDLEARINFASRASPEIAFRGLYSSAEIADHDGIHGVGNGGGVGVRGSGDGTDTGVGVYGTGTNGATGVFGTGGTAAGIGVTGQGGSSGNGGEGGRFTGGGTNGLGAHGIGKGTGPGVQGSGVNGPGVRGFSSGGYGVQAEAGFPTNNPQKAAFRLIPQDQPATADEGAIYFDRTTKKVRVYNGTAWVDLH